MGDLDAVVERVHSGRRRLEPRSAVDRPNVGERPPNLIGPAEGRDRQVGRVENRPAWRDHDRSAADRRLGAVAVELCRQLVERDVVAALPHLENERIATARARERVEFAAEPLAGAVPDVVDPIAARGLGHRDREPFERHSEPPRAVRLLDRAHLLGERGGEHIELDQDVGNRARYREQQHDDPHDDRASLRWSGPAHLEDGARNQRGGGETAGTLLRCASSLPEGPGSSAPTSCAGSPDRAPRWQFSTS